MAASKREESRLVLGMCYYANRTLRICTDWNHSAFVGAIAIGDLVKSTLGPKGQDKVSSELLEAV